MRTPSRAVTGLMLALGLSTAATVVATGPAVAAGPLTVTQSWCVATVGPYAGGLDCAATVTGGIPPYTFVWTPDYHPHSQWPVTGQSVRIGCDPHSWASVSLRVTDSSGQTAYGGGTDWCNTPGDPPL